MKDKVLIITGAASGIGLAIASKFAELGARVLLTDVNGAKAEEQASILREKGFQVTGKECNVTSEEALKSVIDFAEKEYGRIDILINNAGLQHVSLVEDFPVEKFELMVKVMLTAPFMAIKHVFPIMKKQHSGCIVNMASINGLIGFAGKAAYNSAKHGLNGLTKVTALEGAEWGITVNAICPGYVDTALVRNQFRDLAKTRNITEDKILEEVIYPLVPQKRLITTEEIANCAVFLCGGQAPGITGQAIVIDGGYTVQ
ncbi:3-hydroxybutyrate dehydrogenase [Dyadobacter luticola]|uniref:3-hydroxybutyrate dehydrogenase n=1 Tax=Dyadobacter luticola TaxID=1979387 RepID=A0A5R9L479_9BACT|nr:3-hydroxybutyrate dehydrogenase [Dyadobacter luticola]TLV03376.1 3-hydroxybutyrate dehydrogenase [Dyadobacter luticola]